VNFLFREIDFSTTNILFLYEQSRRDFIWVENKVKEETKFLRNAIQIYLTLIILILNFLENQPFFNPLKFRGYLIKTQFYILILKSSDMKSKGKKSRRNLFMSSTLMCILLIGTFRFDESSINWIWTGQIQIPIILGITSIILGVFWFIENRKLKLRLMDK